MRLRAISTALITAGVLMSAGAAGSNTSSATRWVVRDLGARVDLGTGDGSLLVYNEPAVNASGMVAGTEGDGQRTRAFVWHRGRLMRLGVLRGDTDSEFVALNDRGQVVGVSFKGSGLGITSRAFLWEKGRMRSLGSFRPVDINEHGQIVGTVMRDQSRAVLWSRGQIRNLGRFPAGAASEAAALNDAGQVVGSWSIWTNGFPGVSPPSAKAFLWHDGKLRSLGTVPGRTGSLAVDINEQGQVVGNLTTSGGLHDAFVWRQGKMSAIDKGTPWEPIAINDRGQVALSFANDWLFWQGGKIRHRGTGEATMLNERGKVTIADYGRAIPQIWASGTPTRLPLLPGDDGGAALALNERDQVAGFSCKYKAAGKSSFWRCHVVLWTTVRP